MADLTLDLHIFLSWGLIAESFYSLQSLSVNSSQAQAFPQPVCERLSFPQPVCERSDKLNSLTLLVKSSTLTTFRSWQSILVLSQVCFRHIIINWKKVAHGMGMLLCQMSPKTTTKKKTKKTPKNKQVYSYKKLTLLKFRLLVIVDRNTINWNHWSEINWNHYGNHWHHQNR